MKQYYLFVFMFLSLSMIQAQTYLQKVISSDWESGDQFGHSVALDGNYAIVGAKQESHDTAGQNEKTGAGAAYIFEYDSISNSWSQVQKLVASDRQSGDQFGFSVAISGDYAIIGANREDEDESGMNTMNDAGSAYVFQKNGEGIWTEVQKLVSFDNRKAGQEFGRALDIEGDFIYVGAYHEGSGANPSWTFWQGAVFVFQRNNNDVWTSYQKIKANNIGYAAEFGSTVSVWGNFMVVGAPGERRDANGQNTLTGAGAAYFFQKNDSSGLWEYVQKVNSPYRAQNNQFAQSVSMDDNFTVISDAQQEYDSLGMDPQNSAGAAIVYQKSGNGLWEQVKMLLSPFRSSNAFFGRSVSLSGSKVLVGSPWATPDANGDSALSRAGAAYLFDKNSQGDWELQESIIATDRMAQAEFGEEVFLQGDKVVIAAKGSEETYLSGSDSTSTSISYPHNEVIFSSYPNPTEGIINIEFEKIYPEISITIRSLTGQLISDNTFHNTKQAQVSIEGPNGFYLLYIQAEKGQLAVQKISKN